VHRDVDPAVAFDSTVEEGVDLRLVPNVAHH
jgi:hypothetical protein